MFGLTHEQEILDNTLSEHLHSTIEPMTMANQSIAMNVRAITSVNQPKVVIFLCPFNLLKAIYLQEQTHFHTIEMLPFIQNFMYKTFYCCFWRYFKVKYSRPSNNSQP
jgi:hypothetical protein